MSTVGRNDIDAAAIIVMISLELCHRSMIGLRAVQSQTSVLGFCSASSSEIGAVEGAEAESVPSEISLGSKARMHVHSVQISQPAVFKALRVTTDCNRHNPCRVYILMGENK